MTDKTSSLSFDFRFRCWRALSPSLMRPSSSLKDSRWAHPLKLLQSEILLYSNLSPQTDDSLNINNNQFLYSAFHTRRASHITPGHWALIHSSNHLCSLGSTEASLTSAEVSNSSIWKHTTSEKGCFFFHYFLTTTCVWMFTGWLFYVYVEIHQVE